MLTHLSVSNIVLIDRLELALDAGLVVLTGETGAGKSIVLDALSLATGARADRSLVRFGEEKGRVTAVFDITDERLQALRKRLGEDVADVLEEPQIILRRDVTADGRSKCFVNDMPVGVGTLKAVGGALLEINGQHDDRGLMNAAGHRRLLDRYNVPQKLLNAMAVAQADYTKAAGALEAILEAAAVSREQEDFLRHAVEELTALAPLEGEEQSLAENRALMMRGARLAEDLANLHTDFAGDSGIDQAIRAVARRADRMAENADDMLEPVQAGLNRAAIEIDEAFRALEILQERLDYNPTEMDRIEERLFEYRRLARKHECEPGDLAALTTRLVAQLDALDHADSAERDARAALKESARIRREKAEALTAARVKAALKLDRAVNKELTALKLGGATFKTQLSLFSDERVTKNGADDVSFTVKTNAGSDYGALSKIASGGELSRFMLALKVVLAAADEMSMIIFDEVDRGVGGATAAAVADRLHSLSRTAQVMLVTHSPQVAARGDQHFLIAKQDAAGTTRTSLTLLNYGERREELARMLSGAEVSDEARSAANALLSAN